MDENVVLIRAQQLLAKHELGSSFPVDVAKLAEAEGYEVRESDRLEDDEAGNTFELPGGRRIIVVNKRNHPYRRRFTVLHEIAHHVLELPSRHGSHLPAAELERFGSRPVEEVRCDVFAAECLVPWRLMKPLTDRYEFTADTVADLSDQFQASRPCVASRFARLSSAPVAYAVAEEGIIKYVIPSQALREARIWIPSEVPLPRGSAAAAAIEQGCETLVEDLDGEVWSTSDDASRFSVHEEVIHMEQWSQTLVLLSFEEEEPPAVSDRRAWSEDAELLPELTGYLSWDKSRR
jgi:hypothetical protein